MLRDKIREIKDLRTLDEKKIRNFESFLKDIEGQKHVFLFYQKELVPYPQLPPESFGYLELMGGLMSVITFNVEEIKKAYADSSISIHFLYVTNTQSRYLDVTQRAPTGMEVQEMSVDVFNVFHEMAQATGGLSESSTNIASLLEHAVDASENYYLLYYAPKDYRADGKFREIKVKVTGKNYRITHRAGYIAD